MTIRTLSAGALLTFAALASNACGDDSDSNGTGGAGGGNATGGNATGGKSTGGSSAGGSATGGSATGGSATGGVPAAGAGGASAGDGGVGPEPGGGGGAPNGEGGSAGEGGGNEGGFAGVPAEPLGPPLLERPSKGEYDCEAVQELSVSKASTPADLLAGAAPAVVWANEFETPGVYWSPIGEDGQLGASTTIKEGGWTYRVSAATRAELTTVVWDESEDGALRQLFLAQLDAQGAVVLQPRPLVASAQAQTTPWIVSSGDGYALLFNEDEAAPPLRFARLDAGGDLVGEPRTLPAVEGLQVSGFIAVDDGFAVTYSAYSGGSGGTYYLALDADGMPRRSAVLLAGGYSNSRPALLYRDGLVLTAYSHTTGGYEESDIATTIRFGQFDPDGNPVGETYAVQAAVEDEQNVDPHWAVIGDDLGLIWGHGSVIYICAGCVPDERLEFVVLDGETFEPLSEVVTIENQQTNGGLLVPEIAVNGPELRIMSAVTYHTNGVVGTAMIRCE